MRSFGPAIRTRSRLLGDREGASQPRRHRPDYVLVVISLLLLLIGLIVVYAISPSLSVQKQVSDNYFVNKQVIAVILGITSFIVAMNVPIDYWRRISKVLIVMAALAALAVQFFGVEINGASRWVQVGGLSFQAVELAKFALLIWLASFLADQKQRAQLGSWQQTLRPLLILLAIIGLVVAVLESDLGSTAVLVAMMAAMTFVVGLPLRKVVVFGGIVLIGLVLAIASSGYRRERLLTYLHPERDCQNAGYQACQALIAVGSGGMFGKGLGRSVQAAGYLPEAANDSIFAIIAEKFGFLGVTVLLGLFGVLFTRLKHIMERAADDYSRLVMVGILAWLSTQTVINIGAMIGLLPLKGITLPFISYGGTSIIFVLFVIGISFQISRYTVLEGERRLAIAGSRPGATVTRRR